MRQFQGNFKEWLIYPGFTLNQPPLACGVIISKEFGKFWMQGTIFISGFTLGEQELLQAEYELFSFVFSLLMAVVTVFFISTVI